MTDGERKASPTRIAFFGSHLRSFHCLRYLLTDVAGIEVVAVVPHRDQPPVRPDQDVRELARSRSIPVLEPGDVDALSYDLGISLLFDRVLPPSAFTRPPRGFVNVHLAPLPRFRGANGVLHAIRLARRDGCWSFGVSMHYIDEGVDTGPVIDQIPVHIFEDDTAEALHRRASEQVYPLFVRNIHRLVASPERVPAEPQSGEAYFFRRGDVDHEVDLSGNPDDIYDAIRALTFPGRKRPYARIGKYRVYLSLDES
jgi:methionyl-tRNA formyltransferase